MVSTVADSGDEEGLAGLVDYSSDPATPRSTPQKSQSKQHTAETKAKGALLGGGSGGKLPATQAAEQATESKMSARRSPESAQPPKRVSPRSKGHFPVMVTVTKKPVASLEKSAIPSSPPMETDSPPPKPGQALQLDEASSPSVSPTGAGESIADGSQAQLQPSAVVPAAQRKSAGKVAKLQQLSVQPQPTGGQASPEKKLPKRRRSEAEKLLEDSVAYASQNPLIDAKRQKLEAQESKKREPNAKGPSPTSKKRAVGSTKPVALATPASEQPDSQSVHPQSGLPESGPAAPISNPETTTVAEVQKTQPLQQARSQGSHASSAHTKSSNSGHVKGIKKRQKNTFSQRSLAAQPKPVSRPSRSTKTQVLEKEQNTPAGTQGGSQGRDHPTREQQPIPSTQEPQAEQASEPQPLAVPAPVEDPCPGPQQPVAAVQQLQDKPSAETERVPCPANANETATDAAKGEGDREPPVAAVMAAAQPVCPPETQAIEPTEPTPVSDVSPVDLVQNPGELKLLSVPSDAQNAAQAGLSPLAQAKQQAEIAVSPMLANLTAAAQSELEDSSKALPEQQPAQTLVPSDQQQALKQAPQASDLSGRQPSKIQPPCSPRQTQKPRQAPQKSRSTPQKSRSTPQKAQKRKAPEQEVQATFQQQQAAGAKLDSPSSQPPSKRQRQEATGGLRERASSTLEAEAAPGGIVAVITQPEAITPQRSSTEILQTVCTSQQQVPDFAALLPDGYEWDDYAKQHFSELLKQVWQTQFEVHAVRDAEGAERQHYAAEKQKDDKRFADQLAESQSHLRAVDVATEKLGQSALALEKENEALQIHLQQMEDARMAVRQKALQQYLLTAQAMDMDFAAPQAEHAALEGSNSALALTWH